MHLATLRPTQPAPVWTAVATGKLPYKSSVYSAARYAVPGSDQLLDLLPDFCFAQALVRLGLIQEEERASDAVRARPMWELLSRYGVTAGVIDWPLTYPAHGVNGYLITDEFLHRDPTSVLATVDEPPLAYPPDVVEEARKARLLAAPEQAIVFAAGPTAGIQHRDGQSAPALAFAADVAAEQIAQVLSEPGPCSSRPSAIPASMRSGTTTSVMPCRARLAMSQMKSGCAMGACWSSTTPISTASSDGDGGSWCGRSSSGCVGLRHGAAERGQAHARAARRRSRGQRESRTCARRFLDRVRQACGERQSSTRVGRRHRPDRAVLLRPADRARSRRLRANRHFHTQIFTERRPITFIPTMASRKSKVKVVGKSRPLTYCFIAVYSVSLRAALRGRQEL